MITISQLARYAGVTVRAVRHYHRIGLLAEPERDTSGYRTYGAAAVVRLIRIRTLAEAGVPLARVQELLDADGERFAAGIRGIDEQLRRDIRRLQASRRRVARLAAGEQLALPESVVGYLDRLRALGVTERYVELERDAWIMIAAQAPDEIDAVIAFKHAELDDPAMEEIYRLLSEAVDFGPDDPRIDEIADLLEPRMFAALEAETDGDLELGGLDQRFVDLLDAATVETSPAAERLLEIFHERGWRGWTRIERATPEERR